MMLANDEQPPMREQIEGLVAYLEIWQHNVDVKTEQGAHTEYNKGAHWGQGEVLLKTLHRLRAILDSEN